MPKNKPKIYPQTLSVLKCVLVTLFFVFAGTPSVVVPLVNSCH